VSAVDDVHRAYFRLLSLVPAADETAQKMADAIGQLVAELAARTGSSKQSHLRCRASTRTNGAFYATTSFLVP
jgi:hypothetical protein